MRGKEEGWARGTEGERMKGRDERKRTEKKTENGKTEEEGWERRGEAGRENHKTITTQSHNDRSYLCALDPGVLRKPSSHMHRDTPCLLNCKKCSGQRCADI